MLLDFCNWARGVKDYNDIMDPSVFKLGLAMSCCLFDMYM